VFSANTTHIMAAASVPLLLAGAARVLAPGGLLLLYGPFHGVGVPTAPSNAAFGAHLRSINPAMGLRDAGEVTEQARTAPWSSASGAINLCNVQAKLKPTA